MPQSPADPGIGDGDLLQYPAHHVVGVIDTAQQVAALVPDLLANGYLDSEIHVHCGSAYAEALDASTGRTGLAGYVLRIAESFGIEKIVPPDAGETPPA